MEVGAELVGVDDGESVGGDAFCIKTSMIGLEQIAVITVPIKTIMATLIAVSGPALLLPLFWGVFATLAIVLIIIHERANETVKKVYSKVNDG